MKISDRARGARALRVRSAVPHVTCHMGHMPEIRIDAAARAEKGGAWQEVSGTPKEGKL